MKSGGLVDNLGISARGSPIISLLILNSAGNSWTTGLVFNATGLYLYKRLISSLSSLVLLLAATVNGTLSKYFDRISRSLSSYTGSLIVCAKNTFRTSLFLKLFPFFGRV